MKLVRKILRTTLVSSLIFVFIFAVTLLIANFMLGLKELSNKTIKVMSDWNALDRITNDILYHRIDSVDLLTSLEKNWIDMTAELGLSFQTLRNDKLLKLLPDEISQSVDEAWYLWLYADEKLKAGQKIFSNIYIASEQRLASIEKITFYEKLLQIIDETETFEEKAVYKSFLSHMYVLDITGESFSRSIERINEDIPDEINTYIYFLLMTVGILFFLVILVSVLSARRLALPVIRMASSVQNMGDEDYPEDMELPPVDQDDDELKIIQSGFIRMALRIHALYDESLKKEREKRQAQFQALQYQINPHFLYNTLGTLRMKAAVQGDREMAGSIEALSRLLRNTINKSGGFITISEEIDIAGDYLSIMQVRYKNRIGVQIEFPEKLLDFYIPSLILQPVLENAILHGLNSRLNRTAGEAVLELSGVLQEEDVLLTVCDNGRGMDKESIDRIFLGEPGRQKEGHIGLKNIHDRIRLLFGLPYGITIESEPGRYTKVLLRIPVVDEEINAETINRR